MVPDFRNPKFLSTFTVHIRVTGIFHYSGIFSTDQGKFSGKKPLSGWRSSPPGQQVPAVWKPGMHDNGFTRLTAAGTRSKIFVLIPQLVPSESSRISSGNSFFVICMSNLPRLFIFRWKFNGNFFFHQRWLKNPVGICHCMLSAPDRRIPAGLRNQEFKNCSALLSETRIPFGWRVLPTDEGAQKKYRFLVCLSGDGQDKWWSPWLRSPATSPEHPWIIPATDPETQKFRIFSPAGYHLPGYLSENLPGKKTPPDISRVRRVRLRQRSKKIPFPGDQFIRSNPGYR